MAGAPIHCAIAQLAIVVAGKLVWVGSTGDFCSTIAWTFHAISRITDSFMRHLILAYGVVAYLSFFGVILYMIGFVSGFAVPKDIDAGPAVSMLDALLADTILVLLFGCEPQCNGSTPFQEKAY